MNLRVRSKGFLPVAFLLAFAVLGGACMSREVDEPQQSEEGQPQEGGTLTLIAEQLTAHLQCDKADNNLTWCAYPMRAVLLGAYEVQPDFSYAPDLLAREVEVDEGPPFALTYTVKDEAQWSDGTPVSSRDLEFTWKTYVNPDNAVSSRTGYEGIQSAEIVNEKTIRFVFEDAYVPYKDLFDYVYPAHILENQDWNTVWRNCVCDPATDAPIASGPFVVGDFKRNQSLTLLRNENWWGEGPYLDQIVMPYVPETQTEIQQLRGGEADMIYPGPQPALRALNQLQGVVNVIGAAPSWQHLDFNLARPPLDELFVRQAIAYGIDRQAIVDQLITPIQPDAAVLNSNIYMLNQEEYEPHFDVYSHDPRKATLLLEDNGCTTGDDGIYVCNGERLSFGYTSTAGNKLRELMFQIIQANLKDVGIEVKNEFSEADIVFGPKGVGGSNYDMVQFAWVGGPDPAGAIAIFACEGVVNYNRYCNQEVTDLLETSNVLLDPAERTATLNRADELMAQDVPVLPLWQYPQVMAFQNNFHGLQNNTTTWGPLWNAEQIWMEQE